MQNMHYIVSRVPVTYYLDPRSNRTPGPKFTVVFGPPMKFLDPRHVLTVAVATLLVSSKSV